MTFNTDRITGILSVLAGGSLVLGALQLPASQVPNDIGPGVFPILAGGIMVVCGLLLAVKKTNNAEHKPFLSRDGWKRFGILFTVFVLYAVLLWLLGYIISTLIILYIVSSLFSADKPYPQYKRIIFSVLITVATYLIFSEILAVRLPEGKLLASLF